MLMLKQLIGQLKERTIIGPNWEEAKNHGKANKPGIPSNEIPLRCKCCNNQIQKQDHSLCLNTQQFTLFGFGFPLFYNLLQFCIIMLMLLILASSAPILANAINQNCLNKVNPVQQQSYQNRLLDDENNSNSCQSILIIMSNSSYNISTIQKIMRMTSFFGCVSLLIYLKYKQRKLVGQYLEKHLSESSYALLMRGLPKCKDIKKMITNCLKDLNPNCKINKIILLPSNDFYKEKQAQIMKIVQKKRHILVSGKDRNQIILLDQQIDSINLEIQSQAIKRKDLEDRDELQVQKVIIILNTPKQQQQMIKLFNQQNQNKISSFFISSNLVTLTNAPEPKEILWRNIHLPKQQNNLRKVVSWILSIIFVAFFTVVFYFIIKEKTNLFQDSLHKYVSKNQENQTQYRLASVLVFVTLFMVQLFNKTLMKMVLHWTTSFERNQTTAQQQFSFSLKYSLGMFFTTAVMTLLVEAMSFNNYTGKYGVVEQETIIFFFNGFLVNLVWICHPQYYVKKFQRWRMMGSQNITQMEANELMQDIPYDMGKRYAQIMETMWFTFLYCSLIPIGPFIILVGLCVYYWVDKYNLLRRSTINNKIGSKLPINATRMLSLILIFKPLGQLIFDYQLRNQILIITIIMLFFGLLFNFLPWKKIVQQCLLDQQYQIREQIYQQVSFSQRYEADYQPTNEYRAREQIPSMNNLIVVNQYSAEANPRQSQANIIPIQQQAL